MKNLTNLLTVTALILCTAITAIAQSSMDYNIFIEDIEFTPGVTIDINVNVYVNENAHNWANHGKIFAIEGMSHTANCMKPLAEELFQNPPKMEINEFYAIDMPGRGGSGLPEGDNFLLEDMYFEDYLAVIEGALDYLNNELNIYPRTIIGHSMGGLEVILLQNKLVNEGTSMKKKYKIKNALLLSPAIPAPVNWGFINGGGSSALVPYVDYSPDYGIYLNLPFYVWPFVFFTNTCCYSYPDMVPGAPTPGEVLANGYNSIEAGPILLQLSGMDPANLGLPPSSYPYKPRPEVDEGIFKPKNGVHLTIVSDEFDKMMDPDEELLLYEYLSGDQKHKRFLEVLGEETCHDTHISDPQAIVELFTKPCIFKSMETGDIDMKETITVAPNPATTNVTFYVNFKTDSDIRIEVFNYMGQKVLEKISSMKPEVSMNINQLKPGTYFYRIFSDYESTSGKFIKE